jgi:hypothetical protein
MEYDHMTNRCTLFSILCIDRTSQKFSTFNSNWLQLINTSQKFKEPRASNKTKKVIDNSMSKVKGKE